MLALIAPNSQQLRWALLASLVLAIAAASGFSLGQRRALPVVAPAPVTASAPAQPSPNAPPSMHPAPHQRNQALDSGHTAMQWPVWEHELESGVSAREQPLTPPRWRLMGAALIDGHWQIIIMRQGAQAPDYYKKGDRLPGGYTVLDITQEDVTLRSGRRDVILSYIGT